MNYDVGKISGFIHPLPFLVRIFRQAPLLAFFTSSAFPLESGFDYMIK